MRSRRMGSLRLHVKGAARRVLAKRREGGRRRGRRTEKRSEAPYSASTFVRNTITQAHRSIPNCTMISPFSSRWSG